MKQPNSLAATLVIILSIVLIGAVSWGPRPPGPQQLLEFQADAWNSGNLDGFLDTYADGARLTCFSGSTMIQDRNQLLEHYRDRWAKGESGRLEFSDLRFERMGQDWALAAGRWRLTQSSGDVKEGLFSAFFHRFPREGWKVVHNHNSPEL